MNKGKIAKCVTGVGAAATMGLGALPAFAQVVADTDVTDAAALTGETLQVNATAALTSALPYVLLVGALVIGIRLAFKFIKMGAR